MWVASVGEDKHPDRGGGPEVARINTPGCRRVRDNHELCPPTRLRDVHMEQLYSPVPP